MKEGDDLLDLLVQKMRWLRLPGMAKLVAALLDRAAKDKQSRDPVAPAKRSETALRKVHTRKLDDDTVVHSFATLLDELATITRSTMRRKDASDHEPTFTLLTSLSPLHQKAFNLLAQIQL